MFTRCGTVLQMISLQKHGTCVYRTKVNASACLHTKKKGFRHLSKSGLKFNLTSHCSRLIYLRQSHFQTESESLTLAYFKL